MNVSFIGHNLKLQEHGTHQQYVSMTASNKNVITFLEVTDGAHPFLLHWQIPDEIESHKDVNFQDVLF